MAFFRIAGRTFFVLRDFQTPHPFYRPRQLDFPPLSAPALGLEMEHLFVPQGEDQLIDGLTAAFPSLSAPSISFEQEHLFVQQGQEDKFIDLSAAFPALATPDQTQETSIVKGAE